MIALVYSLAVGNAVRLVLQPPAGTLWSRVLRRTDANFAGAADPNATIVADQWTHPAVLDARGLINGTPYSYCMFSWNGAEFTASQVVQATPAAVYADCGVDPQFLLRERLELGLAGEVAQGRLQPDGGAIQVLTAPFILQDSVIFPCVTVHMDSCQPSERFIGDIGFGSIGDDLLATGWLASWTMTVLGVSLNSDERIAMRQAIRRIVQANTDVFTTVGLSQIGFAQRDVEDTQSYSAPLYMTYGTFTCTAPALVTDFAPPVEQMLLLPTITTPALAQESFVGAPPPMTFDPLNYTTTIG